MGLFRRGGGQRGCVVRGETIRGSPGGVASFSPVGFEKRVEDWS